MKIKAFTSVVLLIVLLSCCNLNVLAATKEAEQLSNTGIINSIEELTNALVKSIEQAIDLVNGDWDAIEINGLYVRLFDEMTEAIEKQGEISGYQIVEVDYSDDGKKFSIKLEPTVYHIKQGDTLTSIAKELKTTIDNLLELNPEITNPDLIYAGNTLRIK